MAVDINSFKADLESLKNQRSVIQAKRDEAERHVTELKATLQGMGFNSIDEAKQAYVKQVNEAEAQHALVKQLIEEIKQVEGSCITREAVMERLNSLAVQGGGESKLVQDQTSPVVDAVVEQSVQSVPASPIPAEPIPAEPIPAQSIPNPTSQPQPVVNTDLNTSAQVGTNNSDLDLGSLLFANL